MTDALSNSQGRDPLRPFWLSWWEHQTTGFELDRPWWWSGVRFSGVDDEEQGSIVAAVMALDEDDARRQVIEAHDEPVTLEWRFCDEQPEGWSPFNTRFLRRDWMRWPAEAALDAPPQQGKAND